MGTSWQPFQRRRRLEPGDRLRRARGHVAGDAGGRRPADRPSPVRRPRHRAARRSVGRAAASDQPALAAQIGNDIVTASGTTLLGADDKAGVAAIMAAAEHLMRIRTCRTDRSESRSRRTRRSDAAPTNSTSRVRRRLRLHARRRRPRRARVRELLGRRDDRDVPGFNTHPGYAKGRMVNAIRLAADFIARLPRTAVAGDDRGVRGLRSSLCRRRVRRADVGEGADPRFRDRRIAGEGSDRRDAGATKSWR